MPATHWTDERLEAARSEGDPAADAVVAAVHAAGAEPAVSALLRGLTTAPDTLPSSLTAEVAAFLEATGRLPAWTDAALVRDGEESFERHGLLALAALLCASLPECYVDRRGVQVLWLTQRLERQVRRRLYETAQMLVDVMRPGGLAPGGEGIRAAQRVRLLHAAIRRLVLAEPARAAEGGPPDVPSVLRGTTWSVAQLGVPVNQEDLAYTLLTFAHVIPRSLDRLGAGLSERDARAWLHAWTVVGSIMGIADDLLPAHPAAAAELFDQVKRRQGAPSPEASAMTGSLIATCRDVLPSHLHDAPIVVMRELLGDDTADLLEVPRESGGGDRVLELLVRELRGWDRLARLVETASPARLAAEHLGRRLVDRLTRLPAGEASTLFDLPQHLATAWGALPDGAAGDAPRDGDSRDDGPGNGDSQRGPRAVPAERPIPPPLGA